MIVLFKSFVESVIENGLQGVAELVPGGGFVFNVVKGTWEKYRQRCNQAKKLSENRLQGIAFAKVRRKEVSSRRAEP